MAKSEAPVPARSTLAKGFSIVPYLTREKRKCRYNGEEYVIKRGVKPMAAFVPVEALEDKEHSILQPFTHHAVRWC